MSEANMLTDKTIPADAKLISGFEVYLAERAFFTSMFKGTIFYHSSHVLVDSHSRGSRNPHHARTLLGPNRTI